MKTKNKIITQLLALTSSTTLGGGDYASFELVQNRRTGKAWVEVKWCDQVQRQRVEKVDSQNLSTAISTIFRQADWLATNISAHKVENCAPDLIPRDAVRQIIASVMDDGHQYRPEDQIPTVDEFMATHYTESPTTDQV